MKKGLAQYALYLEARYYNPDKWSKVVNHKFMPRRIGGWLDEARVALFYGSYEYLMKLERNKPW